MSNPRERITRVSPGVYRRGDTYVVRLTDASGRQRYVNTKTRMEAEWVKRLALIERAERRRRAEIAATLLTTADVDASLLADLRWDESEPTTDPRRPSKREA